MDYKKILEKIVGRKKQTIKVIVRDPYNDARYRLSFDIEIESAVLTQVMTITFKISNREINGEIDDQEFEYWFNKPNFQEEFKDDTYDFFKLSGLGVEYDDFEFFGSKVFLTLEDANNALEGIREFYNNVSEPKLIKLTLITISGDRNIDLTWHILLSDSSMFMTSSRLISPKRT
jgi:hypothetical protein